jgi:integrase/recombinase XerD
LWLTWWGSKNDSNTDIDLDRNVLLVRKTKGNFDRYVPLGTLLLRGIKQHIDSTEATDYLFTGSDFDSQYSQRGVQWVIKSLCKKVGIRKEVTTHTFRHTYATHLLEDGVNIQSVQKALGHSDMRTTMVYLHVAQIKPNLTHSPLVELYNIKA